VQLIEEPLTFIFETLDLPRPDLKSINALKDKLKALAEQDKSKRERETALNALESIVIDIKDKLEQEDSGAGLWASSVTPDERKTIGAKCKGRDSPDTNFDQLFDQLFCLSWKPVLLSFTLLETI
jgi:hypothetical protein